MKITKTNQSYRSQFDDIKAVGSNYASVAFQTGSLDEHPILIALRTMKERVGLSYYFEYDVDKHQAFIAVYDSNTKIDSYHAEWDALVNMRSSEEIEGTLTKINSFKDSNHGRIRPNTDRTAIPHR